MSYGLPVLVVHKGIGHLRIPVGASPDYPATLVGVIVYVLRGDPDRILLNLRIDAAPIFVDPVPAAAFRPSPLLLIDRQVSSAEELLLIATADDQEAEADLQVFPVLRFWRRGDERPFPCRIGGK